MLASLTRVCRVKNNRVAARIPIGCSFLEMILFEIGRVHTDQPYLIILFQALFVLGYYGLMRVSELTLSKHCVKAANIHAAINKKKLLLVLCSSKTHSKGNRPQKIKIETIAEKRACKVMGRVKRCFCPFKLINNYLCIRGSYALVEEPLFIFRTKDNPVKPEHARNLLKQYLQNLGLDSGLYNMQSLRGSDMLKYGYSIEDIKRAGCWRSNAVYKYLRQ